MSQRKKACDDAAAAERAERQKEKMKQGRGRRDYRGAEDEEECYDDEDSKVKLQKLKTLPEDVPLMAN